MKAAEIIKAIRQPVPWVVTAQRATAGELRRAMWPDLSAAAMRLAAKGAVRRSGYAGKTQVGVMV